MQNYFNDFLCLVQSSCLIGSVVCGGAAKDVSHPHNVSYIKHKILFLQVYQRFWYFDEQPFDNWSTKLSDGDVFHFIGRGSWFIVSRFLPNPFWWLYHQFFIKFASGEGFNFNTFLKIEIWGKVFNFSF